MIYVGSAAGPQFDQELENVLVGPVPLGTSTFVLTAPAPNPGLVPEEDLLGATVVLICCSYKSHEFIRVGYWVNNTFGEVLPEGAELPSPLPPEKIIRSILADKPRVTRFPWPGEAEGDQVAVEGELGMDAGGEDMKDD